MIYDESTGHSKNEVRKGNPLAVLATSQQRVFTFHLFELAGFVENVQEQTLRWKN